MVIRISDKTQNYSKVTKLLVKPMINVIFKNFFMAYTSLITSSLSIIIYHIISLEN